jgi:hypothetical protein
LQVRKKPKIEDHLIFKKTFIPLTLAVFEYTKIVVLPLVMLAREKTPECPFHESRLSQEIYEHILSFISPNLRSGRRPQRVLTPIANLFMKKGKLESE